jgi:hypothetical protein
MDQEIPSPSNFDELWNQALDSYFVTIGRTPGDKAALKRIHNADDLFSQLEAGHGEFGGWRNKHSKFFSALSKAVRPFVLVSGIAQSAVSCTPFAPAFTILGAVFFLVKTAEGVSKAYEWIGKELGFRFSAQIGRCITSAGHISAPTNRLGSPAFEIKSWRGLICYAILMT